MGTLIFSDKNIMKTIFVVLKISFCLFVLSKLAGCNIAAGSYPNAELYEINAPESTLVKVIQNFKKNNPQYIVPAQLNLSDGRIGDVAYWYCIYFYYPDRNEIIYTWVQASENGSTNFAFVSVNEGLILGNWKDINKDFSSSENEEEKRIFEDRILNKIKADLK